MSVKRETHEQHGAFLMPHARISQIPRAGERKSLFPLNKIKDLNICNVVLKDLAFVQGALYKHESTYHNKA